MQDVKNNQGQTVRIYEFEGEEGKRDIETMLGQLDLDALNYEQIYLDSLNRQQTH